MNCGMGCIKYLLFIFNFVFAIGGLVVLAFGIIFKVAALKALEINEDVSTLGFSSTALIVIGAVIFIIAFFGCCGAIRESHCMTVTYGVLLLTLLVIQVAIAALIFIKLDGKDVEQVWNRVLEKTIQRYFDDEVSKEGADNVQGTLQCCGYTNYEDYLRNPNNTGRIIPYSCCGKKENETCQTNDVKNVLGCKEKWWPLLQKWAHSMAYLAIGIAGVELIGIIFAFCLSNSILNVERRGYKV